MLTVVEDASKASPLPLIVVAAATPGLDTMIPDWEMMFTPSPASAVIDDHSAEATDCPKDVL
jgi:hypothetical protein